MILRQETLRNQDYCSPPCQALDFAKNRVAEDLLLSWLMSSGLNCRGEEEEDEEIIWKKKGKVLVKHSLQGLVQQEVQSVSTIQINKK
jgi:hypothetical protein